MKRTFSSLSLLALRFRERWDCCPEWFCPGGNRVLGIEDLMRWLPGINFLLLLLRLLLDFWDVDWLCAEWELRLLEILSDEIAGRHVVEEIKEFLGDGVLLGGVGQD